MLLKDDMGYEVSHRHKEGVDNRVAESFSEALLYVIRDNADSKINLKFSKKISRDDINLATAVIREHNHLMEHMDALSPERQKNIEKRIMKCVGEFEQRLLAIYP